MLLNIDGIGVEFPYNAYDCQIDFIEKVLEALKKRQNAALESPTGTGKTLCLLCGALAFVKDVKSKLTVNVDDVVQGVSAGSLFPKILYASRTHSQLAQVVRELNKTLYKDTKTVTLASRDVLCINEKIMKEENSITKALMCRNLVKSRKCHYYNEFEKLDNAALYLLYNEKGLVPDIEDLLSKSKRHRICPFYQTRSAFETAELILLPYNYIIDPRLRRAHKVELKGNIIIFDEAHNLEAICEESVSVSLSSLDITGAIRECKTVLESVMNDVEEIRSQKYDLEGYCRVALSWFRCSLLESKVGSDRYLLSSQTFFYSSKRSEFRDVLYLNLQDACDLPFRKEDTNNSENKVSVEQNDVAHLLAMLQSFESNVDEFNKCDTTGRNLRRSDGKVYPGQKMIDLLVKAEIHRSIRDQISLLVDRIGQYLAQKAFEEQKSAIWMVKGTHLQKFSSFISTVYADSFDAMTAVMERISCDASNNSTADSSAKNFQLFVTKEKTSYTYNYWCFTPSVAMKSLCMRGVRSIIVTSGTLSPLDAFVSGLGVDIPVRLQNQHVANCDQILTACIRTDSYNNVLCGSYNNRNTEEYLLGVGNLVNNVCSLVPQGVLAFFASYMLMHLCIKRWKKAGGNGYSLWNEICKVKQTFVEPKTKNELKLTLLQFREATKEGNGAIFFAVCRGKVSEGIDFADSESRGVIVIGIPYAPTTEPRVELKRQFLTSFAKLKNKQMMRRVMSAEEWYQTDAVRAVNQAIGRVLRHKDDFGVVVLADSRFHLLDRKRFPLWLQKSIKSYEKVNDFEIEGIEFFKKHGLKVEKPKTTEGQKSIHCSTSSKKRKLPLQTDCTKSSSMVNLLNEVTELYGDRRICSKKSRSQAASQTPMIVKGGRNSALDKIDRMNSSSGFEEFEKIKERFSEEGLNFVSSAKSIVVNRRKLKLKPNSCSDKNLIRRADVHLDNLRKTPLQFASMLREVDISCRHQVKGALQSYAKEQNLGVLIEAMKLATLPANPNIFLAVYGFLNDADKADFAVTCRTLKLI